MLKKALTLFGRKFWGDAICKINTDAGGEDYGMGLLGVWTIVGFLVTELGIGFALCKLVDLVIEVIEKITNVKEKKTLYPDDEGYSEINNDFKKVFGE